MLHLQPQNLLIQKTLNEAIEALHQDSPLTMDRIVSDFDYTTYHISNSAEDKSVLLLSIKTKAWVSVSECQLDGSLTLLKFLADHYSPLGGLTIPAQMEPGYDYTLQLSLNELTQDSILQLSVLKTVILSYPFELAIAKFTELSQQQPAPIEAEITGGEVAANGDNTLFTIKYRDEENIFIKPSNDRITIIFETIFQDETDKIFGKVFLQEFVDARKRNRQIQSAPQVLYSHEPPLELKKSYQPPKVAEQSRRFITFVLFPRHFQTKELQFHSICQLTLFRNYFHYHIKCSKAYMHSRMRFRVDSFIKVLNRAKVDEDDENDESSADARQQARRTFTGRKIVY